MNGIITFDFHNTLVRGEQWFDLEVHELPAAFLLWQAARDGSALPVGRAAAARVAYRRLRQGIVEHGHELPAERCIAAVLEELGLPVEAEVIAAGVEELMRATLDGARPVPGAVETVQDLAGAGITLAIISSAVYHPFLIWALDRFEMAGCFSLVTTSASAGFYKSRPEVFDLTLRSLGASPPHSVHVGDSYRFDVQTAKRVGMRTVWVSREPVPNGIEAPDLTLPSLEGAAAAILALRHESSQAPPVARPIT